MDEHRTAAEELSTRIRWLMLGRVAIITILLGMAVFSELKEVELIPERSLTFYYIIILATYGLTFFYLFFLNLGKSLKLNVYLQAACDLSLITYMVYVTGGTSSIYSVFYTLVIIYSVLFLGRGGGLIVASACSILYGTLLDLEYYGVINPLYSARGDYPFLASYVFSRIFTHILSFYVITFLASFVVEQERKARALLAQTEDAFEQLDMLHRSIVESVNLGILTINSAGRIKSFNRAAQAITDYAFNDVEDRHITEILPIRADLLGQRENMPAPPENRFEMVFQTVRNRKVILGCSLSSLKNSRGEKIGDIMIFQDLTSIKKIEESYEKSRRMAFIGEMAARLAHEIRNPLASISGSIQLLSQDLRLPDSDEKLLHIIMRGKEQLENFLKDFLLLARPTPGRPAAVNTREVIEEVLEALHYVPDWHGGIEISKNLVEDAPVYANRTDIRHIIWNLLLNAVQAMPQEGILQIDTRRGEGDSEWLEIIVSDTGCGIEEKDLGSVFEPFYTTKEHGTGLGLAIVSRIAAYNNGKVEIASTVGQGTKCTVQLPLAAGGSYGR